PARLISRHCSYPRVFTRYQDTGQPFAQGRDPSSCPPVIRRSSPPIAAWAAAASSDRVATLLAVISGDAAPVRELTGSTGAPAAETQAPPRGGRAPWGMK